MVDDEGRSRVEQRLLIFVRGLHEGKLTARLLQEAGLTSELCMNTSELRTKLKEGAGALLLAEETLGDETRRVLADQLSQQPAWSDLPVLVFSAAAHPDHPRASAGAALGNVTFLDRPVHTRTMIAAVHAALRSRQRQYEARCAIESRDAFLAMLGHELRNPLSAITLALAALERKTPTGPRPAEHAVMERQLKHLVRLVDELLDVARVTRGKVVVERRRVDLAEITKAAFEAYELRARERELAYHLNLAERPLYVMGDRQRLEQVLGNLLANAVKYTALGGRIDVDVFAEGQSARVAVTDNGVGLVPEMLGRVFAPFAQVDSSLDRSQGGLGLGLALVQSLISLHGGEVHASSPGLGRGCRFEIQLPRAPESPPRPVELAPPSVIPASPLKVVVVEDNQDVRELFVQSLATTGHSVACAADGPSGLETLLAFRPDVAFVDVGLPGFDGYEVARRARAAGSRSRLVALTGYGQSTDKQRAVEAGFDEHLVKPVLDDDLRRSLERASSARNGSEHAAPIAAAH
jgi:signal transduction histidine kinase/ActR/RegA family two-component response regulator